MLPYRTFGVYSERVVDRIPLGVQIEDVSDPALPILTTVDWIDEGYADGEPLDGKDGTLPSLTWTAVVQGTANNFVSIYQSDNAHPADKLPFIIKAVAPEIPLFVYNVPRVPGLVYTVYVIFTKPSGQDTIIESWDVKIV